jgi:hypothetical protein
MFAPTKYISVMEPKNSITKTNAIMLVAEIGELSEVSSEARECGDETGQETDEVREQGEHTCVDRLRPSLIEQFLECEGLIANDYKGLSPWIEGL